ncbi:amidase [Pseudooceanicola spongiae]|uniref:Amidase n=1 Tax=Pseudooceanicola spongiae TaxID=2613965 RepID=A0A7L9WLV5_9RHOB|nr:amidase [Pseudooceanicola spongiae]QOL80824.1 amidase [Pseudooceanicola spongiae]
MDDAVLKTQTLPSSDASEICRMSAADLTLAYASGALSPVEATRAALERSEQAQARCNAFTLIDHDAALTAAFASEARWRAGTALSAIDGVPGTIKDIVTVAGWPLSNGSTLCPDSPCAEDAPSVARLRKAGMVMLGVTTTPEFGWKALTDSPRWGITRNPWDLSLTPGGSSGGAAVAASMGAGVLHLGTDGAGSIRIPAAFTGIAGIKPTFGRVPAYPASAFGTVAHIGPMARRVEDVELMLSAMSGRDRRDWFQGEGQLHQLKQHETTPAGLHIAVWKTPPGGAVDPDVAAHFERSLARFEAAGAILEEIDLPMLDDLYGIATRLWFSSARVRLEGAGALDTLDHDSIDPGLLEIAEDAAHWSTGDYLRTVSQRAEFGAAMDRLTERFAYILAPACTVLPFEAGHDVPPGSGMDRWFRWAGFSYPINLSQQPAAVVPAGLSANGLPQSLQIISARGRDSAVLALAKWWQRHDPDNLL